VVLFTQRFTGIWDCLSSQDVVNFVRRKVWEGKELAEICEMICDHCLAPDTTSSTGIGCDNMTILIVALLQGRTKEDWYSWIHDRVERGHGHETPLEPPQLYAPSRIMSFKARREAQAERERARQDGDSYMGALLGDSNPFGSIARVLGRSGPIPFHSTSRIVHKSNHLMFENEDSDEEDALEQELESWLPERLRATKLENGTFALINHELSQNLESSEMEDIESARDGDGDVYMDQPKSESKEPLPTENTAKEPLPTEHTAKDTLETFTLIPPTSPLLNGSSGTPSAPLKLPTLDDTPPPLQVAGPSDSHADGSTP
jgi:protein phosphatase 2C family protein 2/3